MTYHVVVRARGDTTPFWNKVVAETTIATIIGFANASSVFIATYCLMPDHLHLLLSPGGSGLKLGDIVGRMKGITTRRSWDAGWTGTLWQPGFYDHILRKNEDITEIARYIYENPDRKGLDVDYPYRFVDSWIRGFIEGLRHP